MRLTRLKILGFKSFAEKAELTFGSGITALVGPNGCGKTNIVEALRWVLGEQNPRVLRCARMDELIFAGSSTRKPLGMVEVTASVEDDSGGLPGGAAELMVTRRLFKDGQSQNLINRQPALVRDIRDLFLDAGVGAEGYSLLERDMIDQVLTDSTGTRRTILEQAAGIARYRDRVRKAQAKLEASHQDMLRLSDLLAEVKSQVISLSRQAGKAARYRTCQEEIAQLSRTMLALERQELVEQQSSLKDRTERCQRQRRRAMERLQQIEQRLRDAAEACEQMEQGIAQRRREAAGLEQEQADLVRQERFLSEQLGEQRQRAASATERSRREQDRFSQLVADSVALAREGARLRRAAVPLRQRLQEAQSQLSKLGARREATTRRVAVLEQTERKERNRILAEQRNRGVLLERRRHLTERVQRTSRRIDQLSSRVQQLRSARGELGSERAGTGEAARRLEEQLRSTGGELDTAKETLSSLTKKVSGYSSRIEFLRALRTQCGAAFESLLDTEGVVGSLGVMVTATRGWEQPVRGALGEASGWLVLRTWADAIRLAAEAAELPRGKFVVMEEFLRSKQADPPVRAGSVAEHVSSEESVAKLVNYILGSTAVTQDLETAQNLVAKGAWPRAVTSSGEVVEAPGVLAVGQLPGLLGTGERLADEERRLEQAEREVADASRRVEQLGSRSDEITTKLHERRTQNLVLAAKLERTTQEETELTARLEQLSREKQSSERELDGMGAEAEEEEVVAAEVDELRATERSLAGEEAELSARVRQLTREAAEARGRLGGMFGELRRLAALRRAARTMAAEATADTAAAHERAGEVSGRVDEVRAAVARLEKDTAPYSDEVAALETKLAKARERVSKLERQRGAAWERLEGCRERLHKLDVEEARVAAMWEALRQRVSRELACSLDDIPSPEVEGTVEELTARIQKLTGKREGLGSINFAAEQEHGKAKERYEFLDSQLRDLTEASTSLREAMARVKETAKALFLATLDSVRTNFQYTFRELFDGGEADLRLVDEEDPLASGVDIVACPGGKRLRRIEVLSGGEKALTAIALLFGIYLVRPSPVCVLDEIDAPLDDANVERFLDLLRGFASGSQFVIVTHNRRTMRAADLLYGITMGEPGVSQVVSVRLPDN